MTLDEVKEILQKEMDKKYFEGALFYLTNLTIIVQNVKESQLNKPDVFNMIDKLRMSAKEMFNKINKDD